MVGSGYGARPLPRAAATGARVDWSLRPRWLAFASLRVLRVPHRRVPAGRGDSSPRRLRREPLPPAHARERDGAPPWPGCRRSACRTSAACRRGSDRRRRHGSRRWRRPAADPARRRPRSARTSDAMAARAWSKPVAHLRDLVAIAVRPDPQLVVVQPVAQDVIQLGELLRLRPAIAWRWTRRCRGAGRAGAGIARAGARPRPGRAAGERPRWRGPGCSAARGRAANPAGPRHRESRRAPRRGCG